MYVNFKTGPPAFVFVRVAVVKDMRLVKERKELAPALDICVAHMIM